MSTHNTSPSVRLSDEEAEILNTIWRKRIAEKPQPAASGVVRAPEPPTARSTGDAGYAYIGQINFVFAAETNNGNLHGYGDELDLNGTLLAPSEKPRMGVLATWSGLSATNRREGQKDDRFIDPTTVMVSVQAFISFLGIAANLFDIIVDAWKKFEQALKGKNGSSNTKTAHVDRSKIDAAARRLDPGSKPCSPSQNFPKKPGKPRALHRLYDRASGSFTPKDDVRSGMHIGMGTQDGNWYEPPQHPELSFQIQEAHPDAVTEQFNLPTHLDKIMPLWINDPESDGQPEIGSIYGVLYVFEKI